MTQDEQVAGNAGRKGKGAFAARDFKRGEVIMHFHGRVVQLSDLPSLTNWDRERRPQQ